MAKRKLHTLDLATKIRLIEEIEKGHQKKKTIAEDVGIPNSTLSSIWAEREKLRIRHGFANIKGQVKRHKVCEYESVDKAVFKWFESQSQSSLLCNNNSPRQVSVGSQACASILQQQFATKSSINNFNQPKILMVGLNKSSKLNQEEEGAILSGTRNLNIKTSTSSRESIVPPLGQSEHPKPIHYSSTNFLTSKLTSINYNTSLEVDNDNTIYTDINDICRYKYPNECTSEEEHKISNFFDIYATVNLKTKSKSKLNHISDAFFEKSINKYMVSKKKKSNNIFSQDFPNYYHSNDRSMYNNFNKPYIKPNDTNEIIDSSSGSYEINSIPKPVQYKNATQSELHNSLIKPQAPTICNTLPFPIKSELSCEDSNMSYDSYYKAHGSSHILPPRINQNCLSYGNDSTEKQILISSNSSRRSSEKLEQELSSIHIYSAAQFKHKEENICFHSEKESWLKSSSYKDLLTESGKSKPMNTIVKGFLSYNRIESPITRYDDSGHFMYVNKNRPNHSCQHSSAIIDSKIYSSSYPGSTRGNFKHQDHICANNLNYTVSQDDISHDSYVLLEKIDNKFLDKFTQSYKILSCSIDSGNFIPSDDDIPVGSQKYRSAMDVKSKSVADIMNEIWDSEDPRYLPREKFSVKSDGSFYKKKREDQDSHSSSQESRSDIYENKASQNSCFSKKSRDSLYHTASKKSRETTKSKSSVVSSCASKESLADDFFFKSYEMPTTIGKKIAKDSKNNEYQHSRWESKSCYCDGQVSMEEDSVSGSARVKSFECLPSDLPSLRLNEFICKHHEMYSTFPSKKRHKSSNVHSISLQNVEIYTSAKSLSSIPEKTTPFKNQRRRDDQSTCSSNKVPNVEKDVQSCETTSAFRRKSDTDNIFSFDRDKIESLTSSSPQNEKAYNDKKNKKSPDYPLTPELISEFDKQVLAPRTKKVTRKEELMAKTHFEEYNPKVMKGQAQLPNVLVALPYSHVTVERTKSDPNSLANRSGLCKTQRRHVLIHQKSIDLTPADSSEEDYFYKQIPSAPPQCKNFGNFELPESCDTPEKSVVITKSEFESPKSFFREFEHRTSNFLKEDIPYMLHKRHILHDEIPLPIQRKNLKTKSPKFCKSPNSPITPNNIKRVKSCNKIVPDILDIILPELRDEFLFSQNVDLSKIDPIKQEADKSIPKTEQCGIAKQRNRKPLEKLNTKFCKIETDSAAGSNSENINTEQNNRILEQKRAELTQSIKTETIVSTKVAVAKRIISKTRTVNKIRKGKTRITSFSSDDESLDSDDVFGSAEPIPSTLEFSPPQSRKEIEPILRIEQSKLVSAAWGRGQTMSSTEIEGSPPQCRRLAELESRYDTPRLDSTFSNALELRRISERSISIPSSEEENDVYSKGASVNTGDCQRNENKPFPILTSSNVVHSECQMFTTCDIDGETVEALNYTLKNNDCRIASEIELVDYSNKNRSNNNFSFEFSHARLNLSEGSSVACFQDKKSTPDSPSTDRRTKSLDIPIIPMHKLPPINAFSSKDDTFEIEEEADILEEKALHQGTTKFEEETPDSVRSCEGSIPSAQVLYSPFIQDPILNTVNIDSEESDLLLQLELIEKIALKGVKIKERKISRMELKGGDHLILDIPKYNFDFSPLTSCNSSRKTSPGVSRTSSLEKTGMRKPKIQSRTSDVIDLKSTFGNTKKEIKTMLKENPKFIDGERRLNKDKSILHDETKTDIAKRKERQQKLYESAMKQTITMLSPVRNQHPQYPSPQDDICVKTEPEGDKIILESEFKNKTKNRVVIAKSPQKLDSSLVKFSRSFEESGCQKKLEKANRSFEDRKKSIEDSEKSNIAGDFAAKSSEVTIRDPSFEESCIYNKDAKPICSNKKSETQSKCSDNKLSSSNSCIYSESTIKSVACAKRATSAIDDRKMFANHYGFNEEIDMQAVICERRSLEILKRQSSRSEDTARDSDGSHMPSTGGSVDSYVSIDESTSDSKPFLPHDDCPNRITTIECEEPLINDDYDNLIECHQLKASNFSTYHLSLARTLSDETGSWMTMECEEYIGSDVSDNEPRTQEPDRDTLKKQQGIDKVEDLKIMVSSCLNLNSDHNVQVVFPGLNALLEKSSTETLKNQIENAEFKTKQKGTFSKQSDKSKSSDSWTSGEGAAISPKLGSEQYDWSISLSGKEKSSVEDESSVSYSIARPFGISQDFGDFENQKCLQLKEQMLKYARKSTMKKESVPNEERVTVAMKKISIPVLEKQNPIDFGLDTDVFQLDIEENLLHILPTGNNISVNNSAKIHNISKPLRKSFSKNQSFTEQVPVAKVGKSGSDQSSQESKSSFDSRASLSIESKGSFETESSSGSVGLAQRRGELLQKEQQSTWKTFTIESSGSSSIEETFQNIDEEQIYSLSAIRDPSEIDYIEHLFKEKKKSDVQCQDEFIDFQTTFGYPAMTSVLSNIGINSTDIIGYCAGFIPGRTLSRISERSTASEKSSVDDDVSKASTLSVSMRDESGCSSDRQPSLSSDSRSNTNLAYISDADRRTSAEMPDIPCDSATAERFSSTSSKNELRGSTIITGRFAVTQVDEHIPEEFDRQTLLCFSNPGSQDSEDWPLPEIPYDFVPVKPTELIFLVPDSDNTLPKTFSWKGNIVFQSQGSKDQESPSVTAGALSFAGNVEPCYSPDGQIDEKAPIRSVAIPDCNTEGTTHIPQYFKFESNNLNSTHEEAKILRYTDTSYLMLSSFENGKQVDNTCLSLIQNNPSDCFDTTSFLPYSLSNSCCSVSKSEGDSSSLKEHISEDTITIQPMRYSHICSPVSAADAFSNDDLTSNAKLSPNGNCVICPSCKNIHGSKSSDRSGNEVLPNFGVAYNEDQTNFDRGFDKRPNVGSYRRCSHSSHSEEETSSFGTDLDGTVRLGLQQKKCTHSSHSEDTSIGISISEWSTGTNTVHQYANLSGSDSLSAVSNHSFGVKGEKSNLTKSIMKTFNTSSESLNGEDTNFCGSKKLSLGNSLSDGLLYDILSNSGTDKYSDSKTKSDDTTLTLTDVVQTATEWSTSSSSTFSVPQPQIKQTKEKKHQRGSYIEYMPLKYPLNVKKVPLDSYEKVLFPLIHRNKKKITCVRDNLRTKDLSPDNVDNRIEEDDKIRRVPDSCIVTIPKKDYIFSGVSKNHKCLKMMLNEYQGKKISCEEETFSDYLYPTNEKLSARYRSQDFLPHQKPIEESAVIPENFLLKKKKILLKYNSCDDKILFRSQIKENKYKKLQHSQSFHGQFCSSDQIYSSTSEGSMSKGSEDNSSSFPFRKDKSEKQCLCSSSSLCFESAQNQMIQKPLRKGSLTRKNITETPVSGNITNCSIDLTSPKLKTKCSGCLYNRTMTKNRIWSERFGTEGGEGNSVSYRSENEKSKSENNKHQQFNEQEALELCTYDDYHTYKVFSSSNIAKHDISSNNLDELDYPRYDSLQNISSGIDSQSVSSPAAYKESVRPVQQKKLKFVCEDKPSFSEFSEGERIQNIVHKKLTYSDVFSEYENDEINVKRIKCGTDIRVQQSSSNGSD